MDFCPVFPTRPCPSIYPSSLPLFGHPSEHLISYLLPGTQGAQHPPTLLPVLLVWCYRAAHRLKPLRVMGAELSLAKVPPFEVSALVKFGQNGPMGLNDWQLETDRCRSSIIEPLICLKTKGNWAESGHLDLCSWEKWTRWKLNTLNRVSELPRASRANHCFSLAFWFSTHGAQVSKWHSRGGTVYSR